MGTSILKPDILGWQLRIVWERLEGGGVLLLGLGGNWRLRKCAVACGSGYDDIGFGDSENFRRGFRVAPKISPSPHNFRAARSPHDKGVQKRRIQMPR